MVSSVRGPSHQVRRSAIMEKESHQSFSQFVWAFVIAIFIVIGLVLVSVLF